MSTGPVGSQRRPTRGVCERQSFCLNPILHSLQILSLFFGLVYLCLFYSHPFLTSHPPPVPSCNRSSLPPIPYASVCQVFDRIPLSLLLNISQNRRLLDSSRSTNFLFALFLLLAGDIQLNPGPPHCPTSSNSITSLKFALLNAHSASSITSAFDKPASIQDFISTYNLDILAVTETWLSPNTLPSTLNLSLLTNTIFFTLLGSLAGVVVLLSSFVPL